MIRMKRIVRDLSLKIKTCSEILDKLEVEGGYASDLLSDVLANAKEDCVWITMQTHMNIVAVAVTKDIPVIIISNGRCPKKEVLKMAEDKGVLIATSNLQNFELSGRLYRYFEEKR